ncbi:hypothetical protein H1Z61_10150 [Bacillus aquiflavi]|uniref:Uncharacterized protein n=1 Tax=Bacillus aquiflavi TaxID=2672567 RepID=A0A6B3VWV5_9BACI|nr:hypothetical protein [Bacillus aquiflavi]MBA4537483.1 hypothetical protein [Bacillus aquiflavi]NEY81738.1 hypothetical protein [Bacillus aquiflavi]UAC47451.1 hypothetical protein K6959_12205 [Bacillus aquiflavi]
MMRKKDVLKVDAYLTDLFTSSPQKSVEKVSRNTNGITQKQALTTVFRQMTAAGLCERILRDYEVIVNHFARITNLTGSIIKIAYQLKESYQIWFIQAKKIGKTEINRVKEELKGLYEWIEESGIPEVKHL